MKYEKKLELAKEALESGSYDKKTIEYIFPELKESEDERIRKTLIEYFNTYPKDYYGELKKSDILSFLKKLKPINNTDDDIVEAVKDPSVLDFIEPLNQFVLRLKKFKEGEWIVWKDKNYKVNYNGCGYELFDQNGLSTSWDYKTIEDNAHLWTIQDAKDGDVLAFYSEYKGNKMVQVGIIEKYIGRHGGCSNSFKTYVGVNWENNLQLGKYMGCSDIHPATKEQRDLLFQKMKEAGYEWDAEKKEPKKIGHNSEHRICYNKALQEVQCEIDTLEQVEADLEKELETLDIILYDLDGVAVKGTSSYLTVEDVKDIAKRFFELGLKAKGE